MRSNILTAGTLALIAALPATALASDPPPSPAPSSSSTAPQVPAATLPFAQPQTLASAHVWVASGEAKRELPAAQVQVTQTQFEGMHGASIGSSMLKSVATTALAVVAGPIGAVASSAFSMFGHHTAPRPKYHAVLALAGRTSSTTLPSGATVFECEFADTPGVDPDAYAPVLLKLTSTKDNWRIVSVSTASDPSSMAQFMMPAGMPNVTASGSHEPLKLDQTPVDGASLQTLGRGHVRITLSQPLPPGEYGIALRPVGDSQDDGLQRVLRTVWDFTVPAN